MSSDLEGDLNQDGIIDEMDRVRGDLDCEINDLGKSVRSMFDWQAYVRSAPLASVGAALVLGYLLAPRIISRQVTTPVGEPDSSKGGIVQSLFGIVIAGAARAGTVYVADLLTRNFVAPATDSRSAADSTEPPFDVGV